MDRRRATARCHRQPGPRRTRGGITAGGAALMLAVMGVAAAPSLAQGEAAATATLAADASRPTSARAQPGVAAAMAPTVMLSQLFQVQRAVLAWALLQARADVSFDGFQQPDLEALQLVPAAMDATPQDLRDGALRHAEGGAVRLAARQRDLAVAFDQVSGASCRHLARVTGARLGARGAAERLVVNGQVAATPEALAPALAECRDTGNQLMWRIPLDHAGGLGAYDPTGDGRPGGGGLAGTLAGWFDTDGTQPDGTQASSPAGAGTAAAGPDAPGQAGVSGPQAPAGQGVGIQAAGDLAAPPGDLAAPQGDLAAPQGDLAFPPGDVSTGGVGVASAAPAADTALGAASIPVAAPAEAGALDAAAQAADATRTLWVPPVAASDEPQDPAVSLRPRPEQTPAPLVGLPLQVTGAEREALREAGSHARQTLSRFRSLIASPPGPILRTMVMQPFPIRDGEALEAVWADLSQDGTSSLTALVAREPSPAVSTLTMGDMLRISDHQLGDWLLITADGTHYGGRTLRLLSPAEREAAGFAADPVFAD